MKPRNLLHLIIKHLQSKALDLSTEKTSTLHFFSQIFVVLSLDSTKNHKLKPIQSKQMFLILQSSFEAK